MKWYSGTIAQAIQYSHTTKAVFSVFIFGSDDVSQKLEAALENDEVFKVLNTDQYVCIRITADSQEYKQFSEIYSSVQSPSIYCITDKGVPVEIITQLLSPEDLSQKFTDALFRHRNIVGIPQTLPEVKSPSNLPGTSTSGSATSSKPVESTGLAAANDAVTAAEAAINEPQLSLDEKIERARKLALAKQQQKLEQDKEDAKRLEKERRQAGKGMAELKRWQDEEETKRALEDRKKDKMQEQELRRRLKEQIAQDRAERNARSNMSYINDGVEPTVPEPTQKPTFSSPVNYRGKARLQFRMPDGSSQTHGFERDVNLGHVRNFLIDNQHVPFRNFSLWVAYPRREFTSADYNTSLQELGLLPSAALLVLPAGGATNRPLGGNMTSSVWTFITALLGYVVYPLTLIVTYFRGALPAPPPPSTTSTSRGKGNTLGGSRRDNPGGAPGSGSASQSSSNTKGGEATTSDNHDKNSPKTDNFRGSEGNVHRLRTSESDSEDEKATWNGNSTQQM